MIVQYPRPYFAQTDMQVPQLQPGAFGIARGMLVRHKLNGSIQQSPQHLETRLR